MVWTIVYLVVGFLLGRFMYGLFIDIILVILRCIGTCVNTAKNLGYYPNKMFYAKVIFHIVFYSTSCLIAGIISYIINPFILYGYLLCIVVMFIERRKTYAPSEGNIDGLEKLYGKYFSQDNIIDQEKTYKVKNHKRPMIILSTVFLIILSITVVYFQYTINSLTSYYETELEYLQISEEYFMNESATLKVETEKQKDEINKLNMSINKYRTSASETNSLLSRFQAKAAFYTENGEYYHKRTCPNLFITSETNCESIRMLEFFDYKPCPACY